MKDSHLMEAVRIRVHSEAKVRGRKAHHSELADAPVLQLGFAQPVYLDPICEAKRIEAVVAGAVIVLDVGRAWHERHRLRHFRRSRRSRRCLFCCFFRSGCSVRIQRRAKT